MSYAESDSEGVEDDEAIFKPAPKAKIARPAKKRKMSESADEETYEVDSVAHDGGYTIAVLKDVLIE